MLDPQWEFVDAGPVPGGGTMELLRWRNELIIRVDGRELMCNKAHGSEDALADLVVKESRCGLSAAGLAEIL